MKQYRGMKIIFLVIAIVLIAVLTVVWIMFGNQLQAARTIRKLDDGLWCMEYKGDYGFDRFLEEGGAKSDSEMGDYIASFLTRGLWKPDTSTAGEQYGCSTLAVHSPDGAALFGRNFDWEECNIMLVHTIPKDGYESVATCNLDFLGFGADWKPDGSPGSCFRSMICTSL